MKSRHLRVPFFSNHSTVNGTLEVSSDGGRTTACRDNATREPQGILNGGRRRVGRESYLLTLNASWLQERAELRWQQAEL